MKKILIVISVAFLFSCNNSKKNTGEFTVSGHIKNAPDQNIFLEEIYFDKAPEVIDTQKLVSGNFSITDVAPEEGLYRLRLEKGGFYIFINDSDKIISAIDAKDENLLSAADFSTPANRSLIKFLHNLDSLQTKLKTVSADTAAQLTEKNAEAIGDDYKNFIIGFIDTTKSPILALFALGYTQGIDPVLTNNAIDVAGKKFQNHHALNAIINQYKRAQAEANLKSTIPVKNIMAPEINLPDPGGKLFSLSSLRGKYVLVDFWASWCGPCREENPNVVSAYNRFKDKNFTILGVSLDKEKSEWLRAIKEDGLTWNHVSDLKFWNSAVVPLYNIEGIPYNVLVDTTGKIIASNLRGIDLENKLTEVLK